PAPPLPPHPRARRDRANLSGHALGHGRRRDERGAPAGEAVDVLWREVVVVVVRDQDEVRLRTVAYPIRIDVHERPPGADAEARVTEPLDRVDEHRSM